MLRRLVAKHRKGACALLLATLSAVGCSNVLGIADPTPRPPDGGAGASEGGEGPDAGGNANPSGAGGIGGGGGIAPLGVAGSSGQGGQAGTGTIAQAGEPGEAGAPGANECATAGQVRCDPLSPKTPQVCSSGSWLTNPNESGGHDCPLLCDAGKCVECAVGDTQCNGNFPQTCVQGAWTTVQTECLGFCTGGQCVNPRSCDTSMLCGKNQTHNCCRALEVTGGSFLRDDDPDFPATISTFMMDEFEVTNERLKRFVDVYDGSPSVVPTAGAGKALHVADDPGWQASYPLPATSAALIDQLNCSSSINAVAGVDPDATWGNVSHILPANCVDFYVAYAFCIWDGGRLPTEAEWDYAATGGMEQRVYPWSVPPTNDLIDDDHAVGGNGSSPLRAVGLLPDGAGLFGQLDLAGNVAEWTLDYFTDPYPTNQCDDCINASPQAARSVRGGNYLSADVYFLQTTIRSLINSVEARTFAGFRCVYDVPTAK